MKLRPCNSDRDGSIAALQCAMHAGVFQCLSHSGTDKAELLSLEVAAMEAWLEQHADLTRAARHRYATAFYDADVSNMTKVAKRAKKHAGWLASVGVSDEDEEDLWVALATSLAK